MTVRRAIAACGVAAAISSLLVAAVSPSARADNVAKRYTIVFHQHAALPDDVDRIVEDAGGVVAMRLPQIGVVAATSNDANFANAVSLDPRVEIVGEDEAVAVDAAPEDVSEGTEAQARDADQLACSGAQSVGDNLFSQQWDKQRMNVCPGGTYALQRGRPEVVVAVLDTGVERDHPDVASNLDVALSRSFVDGESVFDDFRGHGTLIASTIGAPINTIGMSGVAPKVTLVALKVIDKNDRFSSFAQVAAALVYAGENRFDVANMAFSTTRSHCESEAAIRVFQRAVDFARANGVTLVAAVGNDNTDLSDGALRDAVRIPAELPGVIAVSATGYLDRKPPYSSYGVGKIDVSAPAGDRRPAIAGCSHAGCPQPVPTGIRGRGQVLAAWSHLSIATGINAPAPADRERQCGVSGTCATPACTPAEGCYWYRWTSGTSLAAANASGVAALIISQYGDFTPANSGKPHMSPTAVESILQRTARNQPCPEPKTVVFVAAMFASATCTGDVGYNSFFGKGIIDGLAAVTALSTPGGP